MHFYDAILLLINEHLLPLQAFVIGNDSHMSCMHNYTSWQWCEIPVFALPLRCLEIIKHKNIIFQ